MNPDQISPVQSIEYDPENTELSMQEKQLLGHAWTRMAVDQTILPDNFLELPDIEIKNWLSASLAQDTKRLCNEWQLRPDPVLVEKIQNECDNSKRAELELDYIYHVHKQVDQIIQKFEKKQEVPNGIHGQSACENQDAVIALEPRSLELNSWVKAV